jgi:hypothetical protein
VTFGGFAMSCAFPSSEVRALLLRWSSSLSPRISMPHVCIAPRSCQCNGNCLSCFTMSSVTFRGQVMLRARSYWWNVALATVRGSSRSLTRSRAGTRNKLSNQVLPQFYESSDIITSCLLREYGLRARPRSISSWLQSVNTVATT